MENETNHVFVTEYDDTQGLIWTVDEEEILCDIKKLLSEYYVATFDAEGKSLNISFNNGQKFGITVNEKKSARTTSTQR